MLDNLTNRFYTVFRNIRGQARLDEENIKPALREVRLALLEADVALPVVKDFVADLKTSRSREGWELFVARSQLLLAARAAGIQAIDSVFANANDDEGFLAETRLIKE